MNRLLIMFNRASQNEWETKRHALLYLSEVSRDLGELGWTGSGLLMGPRLQTQQKDREESVPRGLSPCLQG